MRSTGATALKTLLVVEDDVLLASLLASLFQKDGFHVQVAHDGERALDAMRQHRFDAMTLDLLMPVKDGFAVLREKPDTACAATPCFVLTAIGNNDNVALAKKLGATKVFSKAETGPREVLQQIRAALDVDGGEGSVGPEKTVPR